METWRLLNTPIKNTDLSRQRCTELTNMIHTCTSMVQMDCFKVRRINKNVLNTLKIQSSIQCKVSSFTVYVGITKEDIKITTSLKILVSGYKLLVQRDDTTMNMFQNRLHRCNRSYIVVFIYYHVHICTYIASLF